MKSYSAIWKRNQEQQFRQATPAHELGPIFVANWDELERIGTAIGYAPDDMMNANPHFVMRHDLHRLRDVEKYRTLMLINIRAVLIVARGRKDIHLAMPRRLYAAMARALGSQTPRRIETQWCIDTIDAWLMKRYGKTMYA